MENELTHWGVQGMKWGIRRYQNKDGSLTPAGKKRYAKEMAKLKEEEKIAKNKLKTQAQLDKLEQKRKEVDALKKGKPLPKTTPQSEPVKRSIKDLSDAELNQIVTRLELERRYSNLKPEEVSTGKKFVDKVTKDVIVPAATEVGKQVMKDAMTKAVKSATAETEKKK